MNCVKITPSTLRGEVRIPPSKSISHRAIISAGLSNGTSKISNLAFSEDITATLDAMGSVGVTYKEINKENGNSTIEIKGKKKLRLINNIIDCKESGSTLRFLIPVGCLLNENITYTGKGKLIERPLDIYYNIFKEQGIKYSNNNNKLPLSINGTLVPGDYYIRGDVSSQFITGLMYVLPILHGNSKIIITTELESKGYVDLTLDVLRDFSINIDNHNYKEFIIKGNQEYKPKDYRVEGDYSQVAFWIVAGLLNGDISCLDLKANSLQGDKVIIDIVKDMGGNISITQDFIKVKTSTTHGITIDASQCPDLVPILTTLGALSKGTTKIINASRLRIKESDRLKAISSQLNILGADIEELEDSLIINGKESLVGGRVNSFNDHRIAMALAIASLKCREDVIIEDSNSINKSYKEFWNDFVSLGGNLVHLNLREELNI